MIKFIKYEASGNDFILIENLSDYKNEELENLARKLCDRHYGIGADGVLLLYNTQYKNYLRIFNADGSEASMCGNGLRCVAYHILKEGFSEKTFSINTISGEKRVNVLDNMIAIDIGRPRLLKNVNDLFHSLKYSIIDVGNFHAVIEVNNVRDVNIDDIVKKHFTNNKYNVVFVSLSQKIDHINVRVYERGVGETLACGSGSAAAFYCLRRQNKVSRNVTVHLEGGDIILQEGNNQEIIIKGNANLVSKGEYYGD